MKTDSKDLQIGGDLGDFSMIHINKHVIVALQEMGEKEIPGEEDNPRISEYLATVDQAPDDEIPWCAAFINWSLEQAGFKGSGKANAKSYLAWGYDIKVPIVGAIVVFDRGQYEWQGHVGIYMDETKNYIYVLSGNQNNRVSIRPYKKDKWRAYRWSSEFV